MLIDWIMQLPDPTTQQVSFAGTCITVITGLTAPIFGFYSGSMKIGKGADSPAE